MSISPQRQYQSTFAPYPSTRPPASWSRSQPGNIPSQGSYSTWTPLSRRRNTVHDASMTEPTGINGYRTTSLQTQAESMADLVVPPYAPVHVSSTQAGPGTVLETGVLPTGSQTSPIDRVPPPRVRHARQPSYTRRGHTSIEVTSNHSAGRSAARSRTKTISDSVNMSRQAIDSRNHAVTSSPSASATCAGMDTIPFWNNGPEPSIYVPENLVSETRSSQSPYPYEAGGGTGRAVHQPSEPAGAGLPTSGVQANDHSISAGTGAASHYPTARTSYSSVNSLQPGPAPPIADQHASAVNSASQAQTEKYPYPTHYHPHRDSLDYTQLPQQAVHAVQSPVASFSKSLVGYEGVVQRSPHYYVGLSSPSSPPMNLPSQYPWTYVHPLTVPDQGMMDIRQISDLYNPVYLAPPPNPQVGITSPLQHPSPPSEISTEDPPVSPVLFRRTAPPRHPGQRVDVDQQFLEQSFKDGDEESRIRRAVLDEIQVQPWFIHHEKEPQIESRNDPFSRGLGTVGRSVYTVFLAEDKESNQWRCLFGGDGNTCKKAGKRFERVERAIEHIRSHLGHRPFACDGTCAKSYTTKTPCGKRFFASGYLEDHKKRPQKRTNTSQH